MTKLLIVAALVLLGACATPSSEDRALEQMRFREAKNAADRATNVVTGAEQNSATSDTAARAAAERARSVIQHMPLKGPGP